MATDRRARVKLVVAWVMLAGGLIGWPLTALTIAADEPQVVLGISWVAIILEGVNGVMIADDAAP